MSDFVISKENYYFTETLTATSENSDFPKENLAKQSRSFVWRTSGNFNITTSNQKIDFDEGAGALVATINPGNYTIATLLVAIKVKLDAAGVETYTISYGAATGKWTISHAGSTLSLLWNTGANKANSIASTIGFIDTSDDTGSVSYTGDDIAIHTIERIVLDLGGTSTPINTFGLFFDLLNDISLTASATVTLKGNNTDSEVGWASPSVSQVITIDTEQKNAFYKFASNQSYQYWAIEIVDTENPNFYVQIDSAWLGLDLEISQAPEIGFSDIIIDQSRRRKNEYGHEYWDEYPSRKQLSMGFRILSESDKDKFRSLYQTNGNHDPVLICIDPDENVFPDLNKLLMYGRLLGKYKGKQVFLRFFDYEMGVLEVV
jgi:hypothetical protein